MKKCVLPRPTDGSVFQNGQVFKSNQSFHGLSVYPGMAFDLFVSAIKCSFGRSDVSAEWLLISYIGGTPQKLAVQV